MTFVNVAISVPLHRAFTYRLTEDQKPLAKVGARVLVPFRKKRLMGFITSTGTKPPDNANAREVLHFPDDEPIFDEKFLKLIKWISDYYSAPIGEVFSAALPNLLMREKEPTARKSASILNCNSKSFLKDKRVEFSAAQLSVWNKISEEYEKNLFSTILLHGITGSGKTEFYVNLIEKTLKSGKTAILLVPEISLTPQLAGRVMGRFAEYVSVYHSGLGERERLRQWKKMKNGETKVAVGTRSTIFAPLKNVGAIIVDEEHDNSYKQEDSPRYNARDTAIMRGKIENSLVLLGSATPSIESLSNAKHGKYVYIELPERHGTMKLPEIKIVDMRKQLKSELLNPHLSIELMSEIENTLKKKQQTILFLNRRGYANFYLCSSCGFIEECPNCKITLTYHKKPPALHCHYCGIKKSVPNICQKCGGVELFPVGSGTEMIAEIIANKMPLAKIGRLDRDTITNDKKRRDVLSKMHQGDIDILIGTQMVTKGHDFPNVALVGIVSADQSIHFPDFRSQERTFQLITQVSGRAGRSLHPGKVIIQTYSPEHISIETASAYNFEKFIQNELKLRKELDYPPFCRLANIKISGNKESKVIETSNKLCEELKSITCGKIKILGPAPAPLAMLRGKARWQILLKSPSAKLLSETLSNLRKKIDHDFSSGIQIVIDVDPLSMM